MKNRLILLLLLLNSGFIYSQVIVPSDPLLETDPISSNDINVPLYEINLENIKIPIFLSYNNTGIKTNEIPTPLGVSWKLNDIGKITRSVNHLPDEMIFSGIDGVSLPSELVGYRNGWFFSKEEDPYNNFGELKFSVKGRKSVIDAAPDYFSLNIATGISSTFIYKKNFASDNTLLSPTPVFFTGNQHYIVKTNFDKFNQGATNYSDIVFEINDEKGIKYDFFGGPIKRSITRNGNLTEYDYKDFYIKTIKSTHNNDVITMSYEENLTEFYNFVVTANSVKEINNVYHAQRVEQDYSFQSNDRLEPKEINTPREVIKFNYTTVHVGGNDYGNQDVKQLTEISIYNKSGVYITGYTFDYVYFTDNRFVLSKIYKYDNTKTNRIMFREFSYYPGSPNHQTSFNQDMFGYSNNPTAANETLLPFKRSYCPTVDVYNPAADRSPNFDYALKGMLKEITTNLGGTTEYFYQLKMDSYYYGGGMVLSKIIEKPLIGDNRITTFNYSNLNGLVLPLKNSDYPKFFIEDYIIVASNNFVVQIPSSFPSKYMDTNDISYGIQGFERFMTQKSGNYFAKVSMSINFESFSIQGNTADIALVTSYEYIPSYQGPVRTPMLSKKTNAKVYRHNGVDQNTVLISEEQRMYDNLKYESVIDALELKTKIIVGCLPSGDPGDIVTHVNFAAMQLFVFSEPLRQIITKDYSFNPPIETKKQFTYVGEGNITYSFDKLRPKQIITYKNNIPLTKKKYTYLFEMAVESSGILSSQYITPERTLLFEESDWIYKESGKWVLREARFDQYHDDGKLKRNSQVHKNQNDNTFYEENGFKPEIFNGYQTGVTDENILNFNYDSNGKLLSMIDIEKGTIRLFSRLNDKDDYSINTILQGNRYLASGYKFYRNSFETGVQSTISSDVAYTGKKVFTGTTLNLSTYPAGYIVSFWYYINNKWEFSTRIHTGGAVAISKPTGALYVDEVWVRPDNTILTGYTLEPLIGKTAIIDDNGLVLKTIYDEYGREIKQADQDNNLLHKKQYNLTKD